MTFGIIFQNVCLCLEGGDPDGRRRREARGWQRGGQPPWRRVARWRRTVNRWRLVTAGALAFTAPAPRSPVTPRPPPTLLSPRRPPHFRASRKRPHRGRRVFGHLSIILHGSSIVTYALLKKYTKSLFYRFSCMKKKINFREDFKIKKWSINLPFLLRFFSNFRERSSGASNTRPKCIKIITTFINR